MLLNPLSDKEIRKVFDFYLDRAMKQGRGCPDGVGLNDDVAQALNDVAREYPNPSAATVALAKMRLQQTSNDPQWDDTE